MNLKDTDCIAQQEYARGTELWLKAFFTGLVLVLLAIIYASPCHSENCDDIAEILRRSELKGGSTSKLSESALKTIALDAKEVESKRSKYARSLELYLEKIGADKDVDQARIDYEKAQIDLAGQWHQTKQVLSCLKQQEKLAQDWKRKGAAPHLAPGHESGKDAKEVNPNVPSK